MPTFLLCLSGHYFVFFYHIPAWLKNDHLKKQDLSKISHILAAQKKYHNNATLFTNLE